MCYQYSDHGQPVACSHDAKRVTPLTTTNLDIFIIHNDRKGQSVLLTLLLVEAVLLGGISIHIGHVRVAIGGD
jgi:hypothetical protein